MAGCGGGSPGSSAPASTPSATTHRPAHTGQPPAGAAQDATSTASNCTNATCEVRVACDGETHVRRGPAPVKTRSSSVDGRSAIVLDFAGSARDAVIRC